MKLVNEIRLIDSGNPTEQRAWARALGDIRAGVRGVVWPLGSKTFVIRNDQGRGRGQGNGVVPIKSAMMQVLEARGWMLEERLDIATAKRPGPIDAVKKTRSGTIALEWETGNISSSHRAINKMCVGLLGGALLGGVLVVPSRSLYRYLTDRIGNIDELVPYLELWKSVSVERGFLSILVVEHDGVSETVPKIPKGTDGRAIR